MNNETFGITFQLAICNTYGLKNDISIDRIDKSLLNSFMESNIISKIFDSIEKPISYITNSKEFTSKDIKRCPHNFLLKNNETFSVRTFKGVGKMFAPKIVGQSGDKTFNHFFGDLYPETITRENFKTFCLSEIENIIPIIIDFALVSDYNCLLFLENNKLEFKTIKRGNLPDITFDKNQFKFTQPVEIDWNESNTVKYNDKTILELQLHKNRKGYKIRLHREHFIELLAVEENNDNSLLGDTAELAICNVFNLDSTLIKKHNSTNKNVLKIFENHYNNKKDILFPLKPIKFSGTEKRNRGGNSKSGTDFVLEQNKSLSVKTNKSKSYKVCPPEIGQPSHKTFDLHFRKNNWYEGNMNEVKFRELIKNKEILILLLAEYVKFLNECDYILWSTLVKENVIVSKLIVKSDLEKIKFKADDLYYSNTFIDKNSVTIKYGLNKISLGEFQIHSARSSLKFRFNIGNLLLLNNKNE